MGGDFAALKTIMDADKAKSESVRFFIGYSGWGSGQLESEIETRSWYVSNTKNLNLENTHSEDIWSQALRDMGGEFSGLANYPADPSMN